MKKGYSMAMSVGVLMVVVIITVAMYYVYLQVKQAEDFQEGKCFKAKDVQKCCNDWAKDRNMGPNIDCVGMWEVVDSNSTCAWKCN